MKKRKVYIIVFFIFLLALLAWSLVYPQYFNQGIDFLNNKLGFGFPHFWNIPFKLGLDLRGGIHLVYEADLSDIEKENYGSAMQGLRDIIERRVNLFGVQEPIIQTQETIGHHRLVVELAGIKDPQQAIEMIGKTPFLEFKKQKSEEATKKILEKIKELEGKQIAEYQEVEDWQLAFEDAYFEATPLTGRYLDAKETNLGFDQTSQQPIILLQFNEEGAKIFEELTQENIGKRLAIYIDGVLLSAPVVQERIAGGRAQISGTFSLQEAKELARNLKAGALPLPIKLISQQLVGPTLGALSLNQSLKAGIYGLLAIVLFMMLFYRLPGILASLSLFIYISIVLSLFKLIPITLTLAGIGGFILSIGMAVDANVLIFSRFREELKEDKSFIVALDEGFRRSWSSIRDGNLTTIIVALMFFAFGTSFIKGFALTLIIGILVSMFSAIIITRTLMRVFAGTRVERWRKFW